VGASITLAISLANARAGVFAWPAQRTDGSLLPADALPEGARLRLNPALDIRALRLPPAARAIAFAAQRFGLVIRHRTLNATALYAEDPTPRGTKPYPRIFGHRSPVDLLGRFPWDRLRLLHMELRRTP
jgi:hypothetical protein